MLLTTVVGIVLVLAFALVFSIAQGARRVTTSAVALHSADEALRQATTVRAQIAIAVIIANVDRQFGTNSVAALETSRAETAIALEEFRTGIELLREDRVFTEPFEASIVRFEAAIEEVGGYLDAGEVAPARDAANGEVDRAFRDLQEQLVQERSQLSADVRSSDEYLSSLGTVARFLTAFLVPTAVIIVYRELVRRQQQQLELEGRLATERELGKAREDFIANASHELRTPLTSIYGLALLLEEDPALAESMSAREMLGMIISESSDLSRMVEDLLTTARLDADALHYTFENVPVEEEVEEVVNPMLRGGVNVAVASEPATIRVDRLRFRQILRNLLSNARKYGGPNIQLLGHAEEGRFVLVVADDGEGIPADLEERLFQRFLHQGHQPLILGSVGLGLSIVRALTEGMGGTVSYERHDGWTRFVVILPLVGVAGAPHPASTEGIAAGSHDFVVPGTVEIAASEELGEPW